MTKLGLLLALAVLAGCAGDEPEKDVPVEQELAARFQSAGAPGDGIEEGAGPFRKGIATFEASFR